MALTDAKLKAAKTPDDRKQVKLFDGGGLFLLVTDKGGKRWRFKYRYDVSVKPTGGMPPANFS